MPFRSRLLQCKQGEADGECLTPAQVAAANAIYSGAKKSDGTADFPGLCARQ